jgi:hypothetical protein
MSYYFHSKTVFDHGAFANGDATLPIAGEPARNGAAVDHAVDAALRSVPLPDGLMTRLGKLVYTMPEETADQRDWLGC